MPDSKSYSSYSSLTPMINDEKISLKSLQIPIYFYKIYAFNYGYP